MIKASLLTAALLATVPFATSPVAAQGVPQALYRVDVTRVATGFRASKLIGAAVTNEANETIGKIDDLIVNRDDRVPYAILSIGGFLGLGDHLVAVPYEGLRLMAEKVMLPGATKDALKAMPQFTYTK